MKILISQAVIVDKRHPDNGKKRDILIDGGKIAKIAAKNGGKADQVISEKGLCVSIGWMELRADFRDPGAEHAESIESGMNAAAAGGFTTVALSPDTLPAVDGKGAVEYLLNRSRDGAVVIVPVGAVSKGLSGESLAEMYDMYAAGAKLFGDDKNSIREAGLLQRALLYTKNFGATVMHFPYDMTLVPAGQMNEGVQSTSLGLKGIPSVAEESAVMRDIGLASYTDGKLHLGPVSLSTSVDLVKKARKKGLHITCETTAAHLAYNETVLADFDTDYKLMPPLRDEANRKALINALAAGEIQVISSDHSPTDEEHKKLEFDYAAFGTAGIETFFPLVYGATGEKVPLEVLTATFSIHPREVAGMEVPEIAAGAVADLTLFSPSGETDFAERRLYTKAYNTAEKGKKLPGRVIGIFNRGTLVLNK